MDWVGYVGCMDSEAEGLALAVVVMGRGVG